MSKGVRPGLRHLAPLPPLLLALSGSAHAAPAAPLTRTWAQPGGGTVQVRQQGDEWCSWKTTPEGYTVAPDANGTLRYVEGFQGQTPRLSRFEANRPAPGMLQRGLRPVCSSPHELVAEPSPMRAPLESQWDGALLFLLVDFQDRRGGAEESDYAEQLQGQAIDYFQSASYGAVTLYPAEERSGQVDNGVVGWLTLPYNHPNTGTSTTRDNQRITKDALSAADSVVDFASFDRNADGYVDADELAVVVIVAGFDSSYGGYQPSIWGHQWDLDEVGAATLDGVQVGASHGNLGGYVQVGELHQNTSKDGHLATMGVVVHELSHLIFRLPELYDVDGSSNGAGYYCVMSVGTWGFARGEAWLGQTPVMPSAWVRASLGWSTCVEGAGTLSAVAIGSSSASRQNSCLMATTPDARQWFLMENRQPLGYDKGLEGLVGDFGGLAIWHVDASVRTNRIDQKRLVDLEEADGGSGANLASNLWVDGQTVSTRTFDRTSTPSSRLNAGIDSGVSTSRFSASGEVMSASVTVGTASRPGF